MRNERNLEIVEQSSKDLYDLSKPTLIICFYVLYGEESDCVTLSVKVLCLV